MLPWILSVSLTCSRAAQELDGEIEIDAVPPFQDPKWTLLTRSFACFYIL